MCVYAAPDVLLQCYIMPKREFYDTAEAALLEVSA